ncbi:uncharacterized protein TEOVI_000145700 [Trypanosoma equiperdum]|nr:hypothetical protein, conserved [Trypanosoma equiperdum]
MTLSSGSLPNFFPSLDGSNINNFPDEAPTPMLSMRYDDGFMNLENGSRHPSSNCNTPSVRFHNGLAWVENWQLSSSNLVPQTPPSAAIGPSRSPSSFSLMKYSHDPYGVRGNSQPQMQQRAAGCMMVGRGPSPNGCSSPVMRLSCVEDGSSRFAPGHSAVVPSAIERPLSQTGQREFPDGRPRRKGRARDRTRGGRSLADVPPPTSMRYFPPPPPCLESMISCGISQATLVKIATRWYERTIACEQSYVGRLHGGCAVLHGAAAFRRQPILGSLQPVLCPRMELTLQFTFDQWLKAASRWWETVIRPMTMEYRLPPPYVF